MKQSQPTKKTSKAPIARELDMALDRFMDSYGQFARSITRRVEVLEIEIEALTTALEPDKAQRFAARLEELKNTATPKSVNKRANGRRHKVLEGPQ